MDVRTIDYLGTVLTEKNLKLTFAPNSVLNTYEDPEAFNIVANKIADKLIKEIEVYHNTILPIYKNLVTEISALVESDDKEGQSILDYKIKRHDLNQFMLNVIVTDKLGTDSVLDLDKHIFQEVFIGKPYDNEELKKIFTHPVKSLDIVLKETTGNFTDADLMDIWDKYLSKLGSKSELEYLDKNNSKLTKEISLIYTALVNLYKEKPSWCEIENDLAYNDLISKTLAVVEKLIIRYVKEYKDNKSNLLVLNLDRANKTALVNSDLYDGFLSEGGKPETILGLFGVDEKDYIFTMNTLSYIKGNTETLNNNWEKLKHLLILNDKLKKDDLYKTKLSIVIGKVLQDNITDELKLDYNIQPNIVNDKINELLKEENINTLRHPFKLSVKILGDIVFEKTNFGYFAKSMKKYTKLMELNKQDLFKDNNKVLATFAGLDIVMDYILQQIDISDL